jgi:hypothetical protein
VTPQQFARPALRRTELVGVFQMQVKRVSVSGEIKLRSHSEQSGLPVLRPGYVLTRVTELNRSLEIVWTIRTPENPTPLPQYLHIAVTAVAVI